MYLSIQLTRFITSSIEAYVSQASSRNVIAKYNLADIILPSEKCGSKYIINAANQVSMVLSLKLGGNFDV